MEEDEIIVTDFVTGNRTVHKLNTPKVGHSGNDAAMMKELVSLISQRRQRENVSNATQAMGRSLQGQKVLQVK